MYNKLGYSRGVIANLSDAPNLVNPQTGETVFCTENYRVLTYDGALWMCDDFVRLVNGSGSTRAVGDLVCAATGVFGNVVITNATQNPRVIGPVVYSSTNGSPIAVAIKGKYKCRVDFYSTVSPITTIGGKAYTYSSGNLGAAIDNVSTPLAGGFFGWVLEPLPAPLVQGNRKMLIRGKVEFW
jgi:hypothetical protein